ncbi:MAG: thioredoxin family protein [Gemmatimonadota bacterium]|jgi:hypothetical protein|nr:MAG: thioredoxin family protein [Gemmatimonadota bacterium]
MTAKTDYRDYWERAVPFDRFLSREVERNHDLWEGIYRRARTPAWARRRAAELVGHWRLLVLAEDWCGDAVNTVPVLARLAEDVPHFELRVLGRDENPELMGRHLTNGTRSIPMAIILGERFGVAGAWGPRPAELQRFVISEKARGVRPPREIYAESRRWYARDRGETTLSELLDAVAAATAVD